jgi:hypothetical protein
MFGARPRERVETPEQWIKLTSTTCRFSQRHEIGVASWTSRRSGDALRRSIQGATETPSTGRGFTYRKCNDVATKPATSLSRIERFIIARRYTSVLKYATSKFDGERRARSLEALNKGTAMGTTRGTNMGNAMPTAIGATYSRCSGREIFYIVLSPPKLDHRSDLGPYNTFPVALLPGPRRLHPR